MTISTLEPMLEFRCNRCWHSNCVTCELTGKNVACTNCGADVVVPEATPERIARAAAIMADQSNADDTTVVMPREKSFEEMSPKELRKLEQEETHVAYSEMDFHSVPLASCLARLAAQFVDGFANAVVIVIGVVMVFAATSSGLIDIVRNKSVLANIPALVIGLFPFLVLQVVQWNLIATRGQTIGKILLWIRIIDRNGGAPGFIQGVILRDWLRLALSFIPFFSIVDAALILTESRRCIHDYIAGTRVVPAR